VVDWNKLEAEVKDEEKKEQLDGDAGVQRLFQQIYAGALLTNGLREVPSLRLAC
jgi:hypothetical protein